MDFLAKILSDYRLNRFSTGFLATTKLVHCKYCN
jgi:hypothetical protein